MAINNLQEGRDIALNVSAIAYRDSRIFYAMGSTLLYSKIEQSKIDRVKCYQENDPTDFEFPDVLASDGGTLQIKGSGSIRAISPFRQGLLVASSEGCWYVTGGPDISTNGYSASKLTSHGMDFVGSFVVAGDVAFYMNKGGIVAFQANEYDTVVGSMVTDQTIKTYLLDNFTGNLDHVVSSMYDSRVNEVHWFNANTLDLLVLDLETQGFYPQTLNNPNDSSLTEVVYDEGRDTFDYVSHEVTGPTTGIVSWNELTDDSYLDYGTKDYEAYLETGPESLGQFALKKTVTSVALAFARTETAIVDFVDGAYVYDYPSGCLLSQRADLSTYTGYASVPRQVYRLNRRGWLPDSADYPVSIASQGDNIVYFEDKVRGEGRVTTFRMEAEKGKDMQLLGFAVDFSMKGRQR
ncbi:head-closure protein [Vibrio phage 1.293.O._10N.261.52.E1]|nr:head-closure protein [Vibrio phage 1.293.O._10N.261.52.E1]